ncbi:hypothetical protein FB451DRAFT_1399184 [Mycena latifolia]|nr:hypothetical protein FB451DRAFT_1399184 [Mycena latifolia]
MHPCLLVCEIFRMICQHLFDSSAKRSLAALAQTCKAFEDTALDLLWFEQTSLAPIFAFIPHHLWKTNFIHTTFERPMLSSDLTRFSYYSPRVKTYRDHTPPSFTMCLSSVLHIIIPQSLVFPNVQMLEFYGDNGNFQWLHFFLGPHVDSITLVLRPGFMESSNMTLSLFPRLKSQYPFLKHASITFDDRANHPQTDVNIRSRVRCLSDAVLGWNRLHSLTVGSLDGGAWLHLPTLAGLTFLKVGALSDEVGQLLQSRNGHPTGFRALRELRIGASSVRACIELLKYFADSPLETFVVGLWSPNHVNWWKGLSNMMARGCAHFAMNTVCIYRATHYLAEPQVPDAKNVEVIIPLFSFPNLTRLVLEPSFPFNLDSNTFSRLSAWSRLESLDLGRELKSDEKPGLLGLVPFAQYCPRLRILRIFVDATMNVPNMADILRIRRQEISNKSLLELNVDDSPINKESVFESANLLSFIFPKLQNVSIDIRRLVRRLGGEVDAWLANEEGIVIPHGPATIEGNLISASFHIPAETPFRIYWRSHLDRPITALCAVIRPPLPGEPEEYYATVHVMDETRPTTQLQCSRNPNPTGQIQGGWFLGPPAFETGFVQLEICAALREPTLGVYLTDGAVDRPALILRFNLVGLVPIGVTPARFRRSLSPSPQSINTLSALSQMVNLKPEDGQEGLSYFIQPLHDWRGNYTQQVTVMNLLV